MRFGCGSSPGDVEGALRRVAGQARTPAAHVRARRAQGTTGRTSFVGPDLVAEFDGYGVDGNCFEGKTTFPGSTYMSMYEVCLQ